MQGAESLEEAAAAVVVAKMDGGMTAAFAAICFLAFCMGWENLVMGAAFAAIAYNSFRGAGKLQKFDRSAPSVLAMNQLYLAAVIILYALFELWKISHGSSALAAAIAGDTHYGPEFGSIGVQMDTLQNYVYLAVYGVYWGLIAGTIIFQGLTAWYYLSRSSLLKSYLEETPPWVVELQASQSR